MSKRDPKLIRLIQLSLLTAILVLMAFTPLGFLKAGPVEITFLTIPVAVGAIVCGPVGGLILGGVFGACSFLQCFGMSAFGATLLAVNPVLMAVLCLVPRLLMGWLTGLIWQAISRKWAGGVVQVALTALVGSLLNTVLFVSMMMLFFGTSDYIRSMQGGMSVLAFLAAFVGVNGLVETGACTVAVTAVSVPLLAFQRRSR